MCTLSIIRHGDRGIRVAFNRDELRTRPTALPPQFARFGPRLAALPTDPQGGGTWLAVNDAGLVMALLNVNPPRRNPFTPSSPSPISRGQIIPRLLRCSSVNAVVAAAARLPMDDFAPFRLAIADADTVAAFTFDGAGAYAVRHTRRGLPLMFTSSGLGDHVVEQTRRELFDEMAVDSPARQDAFHAHRWPARLHVSVRMSRPDACTVSYSVIEVAETLATFRYRQDGESQFTTVRTLPLCNPNDYDERLTTAPARDVQAVCC